MADLSFGVKYKEGKHNSKEVCHYDIGKWKISKNTIYELTEDYHIDCIVRADTKIKPNPSIIHIENLSEYFEKEKYHFPEHIIKDIRSLIKYWKKRSVQI